MTQNKIKAAGRPPQNGLKQPPRNAPAAAPTGADGWQLDGDRQTFPLSRFNFRLMGLSAALIIIGFLLMLGGSSTETEFNPDIFSTRRIVIGPTITFLGFVAMGVSLILHRKN